METPSQVELPQVFPDRDFFMPKQLLAFWASSDFPYPDSRINCARATDARMPVFFWSAVKRGPTFLITSASESFFKALACRPVAAVVPPIAALTALRKVSMV